MPSRGEVLFTEETSEGVSEPVSGHFDGLSYGFQEPRLLPWLTVESNVSLPLTLKKMPSDQIKDRVQMTLKLVGLDEASQLYPHQLSGGMKMRTAIARSLVNEPQVLLLDEPFGALDEITKNRLDDELYSLWKSLGMTVVLVTHSLTEAVYLGQHIHVLAANSGHIEGSINVEIGERSPASRLTPEFTKVLAEAHSLLERAEGGS
jgi:NitT/TauT family transport system ATP-binding protein